MIADKKTNTTRRSNDLFVGYEPYRILTYHLTRSQNDSLKDQQYCCWDQKATRIE